MTAAEIAAGLGLAHRCGSWWRCRCPAHGSRGATLALRDGDRGLIVYCHAGCRRRDILAGLRRLGLLGECEEQAFDPDPEKERLQREAEVADWRRRRAIGLDIWINSHPATATTQV